MDADSLENCTPETVFENIRNSIAPWITFLTEK